MSTLSGKTVFSRQDELAALVSTGQTLDAEAVIGGIGLGISYGNLIILMAATLGAGAIASLLPESVKSKLGTTNDEVIQTLDGAIQKHKSTKPTVSPQSI